MALIDDLIVYWPLNEASGTRVDAHGSGVDLTEVGGTLSAGTGHVYANAAQLDMTVDKYLQLDTTDTQSVNFDSTTPFTAAGWFYLDNNVGGPDSPNYYRYLFDLNNASYSTGGWKAQTTTTQQVYVVLGKNGGLPQFDWHTGVVLPLDTWALFALTVSGSDVSVYLSGTTASTTSAYAFNTANTDRAFYLGAQGATAKFVFDGLIGPVAIWGRALSTAELDEFYNSGAGMTYEAMSGPAIPALMQQYRRRRG